LTRHFIVPFDGETLIDAFINTRSQFAISRCKSSVVLFEDKEKAFEILHNIFGGCLVACEKEKAFPDFLKIMGAMPAEMKSGSWWPIAQDDQNVWLDHQIATNEQNIRFENMRKAA
jgi:hypothetical protein